jgi:hypothetical protein
MNIVTHNDHDKFTDAIKGNRRLIVMYLTGESNLNVTKLCIPMRYVPPASGKDCGCYYFWDSEGLLRERLLVLPASQIVHMALGD